MGDKISQHIFMMPIKWENKDGKNVLNDFEIALKKSEFDWRRVEHDDKDNEIKIKHIDIKNKDNLKIIEAKFLEENIFNTESNDENQEIVNAYNKAQYFYPEVRKIIFDNGNSKLIHNYTVAFDGAMFEINKSDSSKCDYSLKLSKIDLRSYSTGVAVLCFFVENREYTKLQDILDINQYGRRVQLPYIVTKEASSDKTEEKNKENTKINRVGSIGTIVAGKISIKISTKDSNEEYFIGDFQNNNSKLTFISPMNSLIDRLLGENIRYIGEKHSKNAEIIYDRVIDDRMYVVSWVFDNRFGNIVKNYKNNGRWWEYLFIDSINSAKLVRKNFAEEIIKKNTYDRWNSHIFGISNYSFVCLGTGDYFNREVVSKHMNSLYYELVMVNLMQKSTLQKFSKKFSSSISDYFFEIQRDYITFLNNFCFEEITAQDEGNDLYKKIKTITNVDENISKLNIKINQAAERNRGDQGEKLNNSIFLLTIASIVIGLLSYRDGLKNSVLSIERGIFYSRGLITKEESSNYLLSILDVLISSPNTIFVVIIVSVIYAVKKWGKLK